MTSVDASSRPRLARGVRLRVDHITGKTLLLRPEQGFELQGSAIEVLQLCTSNLTVGAIVDHLAARHADAPREEIERDVHRLLSDLHRRGVVELESAA